MKITDKYILNIFIAKDGSVDGHKTRESWLNKNLQIKTYLETRYKNFKNGNYSYREVILCIKLKKKSLPTCKICGKPVHGMKNGDFCIYCSVKCRCKDKDYWKKFNESMIKNHGGKWSAQCSDIKDKYNKTIKKKYNKKWYVQTTNFIEESKKTKKNNRPNDPNNLIQARATARKRNPEDPWNNKKAQKTSKERRPFDPYNAKKSVQTRKKNNYAFNTNNKKEKELYKKEVEFYTKLSLKYFLSIIDQNNLWKNKDRYKNNSKKEPTVDHIYSKCKGFNLSIEPYIIGSPINLTILSRSENSQKFTKCGLTEVELLEKYYKFIEEYPLWQELISYWKT